MSANTETEDEFDVKKYFEWFDATKKLIQETDTSFLGWFDADLTIFTTLVKMKSVGATFDQDSFLARNFNRDGTLKKR